MKPKRKRRISKRPGLPQHRYFLLVLFSVVVGFLFYGVTGTRIWSDFPGYFSHYKIRSGSTPTPYLSPSPVTKRPPIRIDIQKIGKSLPIQAGTVNGNKWDLFDSAVAWLATSAVPGEGNTVLYAHNWPTLWKDLDKLVPGDIIYVAQDGISRRYNVTESRAVDASDVNAIRSSDNRLTLFTCEGSFDQKRRIVIAKPE